MKLKRLVYFSMIAKAQAEDYLEQSEKATREALNTLDILQLTSESSSRFINFFAGFKPWTPWSWIKSWFVSQPPFTAVPLDEAELTEELSEDFPEETEEQANTEANTILQKKEALLNDINTMLLTVDNRSFFWRWRHQKAIETCRRYQKVSEWLKASALTASTPNAPLPQTPVEQPMEQWLDISQFLPDRGIKKLFHKNRGDANDMMDIEIIEALFKPEQVRSLEGLFTWCDYYAGIFNDYQNRSMGFFSWKTYKEAFPHLWLRNAKECQLMQEQYLKLALPEDTALADYSRMGREKRNTPSFRRQNRYLYSRALYFGIRRLQHALTNHDNSEKVDALEHLMRLLVEVQSLCPDEPQGYFWAQINQLQMELQQHVQSLNNQRQYPWLNQSRAKFKTLLGYLARKNHHDTRINDILKSNQALGERLLSGVQSSEATIPAFSLLTGNELEALTDALLPLKDGHPLFRLQKTLPEEADITEEENNEVQQVLSTWGKTCLVNSNELGYLKLFLQKKCTHLVNRLCETTQAFALWEKLQQVIKPACRYLSVRGTTLEQKYVAEPDAPNTPVSGYASYQAVRIYFKELNSLLPSHSSNTLSHWKQSCMTSVRQQRQWFNQIPREMIGAEGFNYNYCFSPNNQVHLKNRITQITNYLTEIETQLSVLPETILPDLVLSCANLAQILTYVEVWKESCLYLLQEKQECFLVNDEASKNAQALYTLGFHYKKLAMISSTEVFENSDEPTREEILSVICYASCDVDSFTLNHLKVAYRERARVYHPDKVKARMPLINCFKINLNNEQTVNHLRDFLLSSQEMPEVAFLHMNNTWYYAVKALGMVEECTESSIKNIQSLQEGQTIFVEGGSFFSCQVTESMKVYHQENYGKRCFNHIKGAYEQIKTHAQYLIEINNDNILFAKPNRASDLFSLIISGKIIYQKKQELATETQLKNMLEEEKTAQEKETTALKTALEEGQKETTALKTALEEGQKETTALKAALDAEREAREEMEKKQKRQKEKQRKKDQLLQKLLKERLGVDLAGFEDSDDSDNEEETAEEEVPHVGKVSTGKNRHSFYSHPKSSERSPSSSTRSREKQEDNQPTDPQTKTTQKISGQNR